MPALRRIYVSVSVAFALAFSGAVLLTWIDSPPIWFYLFGAVVTIASLYQAIGPNLLVANASYFGAMNHWIAELNVFRAPDLLQNYSMEMNVDIEALRHRHSWLFFMRLIVYTTTFVIAIALLISCLVFAARTVSLSYLLIAFETFFFVVWTWILITLLMDLFRDHQLSGWRKAVWVLFLVFIPFLAALVYLITRGGGMRERTIKAQAKAKRRMDAYIREQTQSSPADELRKLSDLKEKGAISSEEFEQAKAKFL